MGTEQFGLRLRPAYALSGSWANKPAAASVPNGYRYMLDGSDGWGAGALFWSNGTNYYPVGGFQPLLVKSLSAFSSTAVSTSYIAGLGLPTLPLSQMLAVPGAIVDFSMDFQRTSPQTAQGWLLELDNGSTLVSQFTSTNNNPSINLSGRMGYSSAGYIWRGEYFSYRMTQASNRLIAMPADGAIAIAVKTGGAGETITLQNLQVYLQGAP